MRGTLLSAAMALLLAGCEAVPRDPRGTTDQVTGRTLVVGVAESPPFLVRRGDAAAGPEAELVEAFARSLDARVAWEWLAAEDALRRLERGELHLVAGGLRADSPWNGRVALSRPWRGQGDTARVMAVPAGENRFLVALERQFPAHP